MKMILFVLLSSSILSIFILAVMSTGSREEKDLEDGEQRIYLQEWKEEKERKKGNGI
ncbi:MAG: hypothetical protein Q4B26_18560 [Eubacteriales bacterium]|nr:hypothetical protein [Eubacteriales bacterium]